MDFGGDINVVYHSDEDRRYRETVLTASPRRSPPGYMTLLRMLGLYLVLAGAREVAAQIPANARRSPVPPGWECNDGFVRRDASCVSLGTATDDEIRRYLMAASIAAYSGSCPCPFSLNRAGRRCGGNSAYSRPGGSRPLCFEQDVTPEQIKAVRDKYRAHFTPNNPARTIRAR